VAGPYPLFLVKVVSSVWFMTDEEFTSNVCIASLYIDCDLFPVVISWDTLPVSDGADWVFFPTDYVYQPMDSWPFVRGTGSNEYWCDGKLFSPTIRRDLCRILAGRGHANWHSLKAVAAESKPEHLGLAQGLHTAAGYQHKPEAGGFTTQQICMKWKFSSWLDFLPSWGGWSTWGGACSRPPLSPQQAADMIKAREVRSYTYLFLSQWWHFIPY